MHFFFISFDFVLLFRVGWKVTRGCNDTWNRSSKDGTQRLRLCEFPFDQQVEPNKRVPRESLGRNNTKRSAQHGHFGHRCKKKNIIEYKRGIREMADSCSSSFRRKCKWQNNTWTFQVREKNKSRVELCKRPFSFFLSSRRESIDYTLQQPTQREQVPRGRCNLLLLRRVLNRKTQQIFFNVFTGLAVTVSLRRERNSKAGVTHISLFLLLLLLLTKKEARGMCFGWDEKMVMGRRCINNNSNRPPSWCSSYTFRSVIIGQKAQWKFLFFLHLTLNAFSSAPSATGCLPDIGIDRQTIV